MATRRKIEVFSSGCALCNDTIEMVRPSDPSFEVIVRSMTDSRVLARAKELGIRCLPAIVIDGRLADCCSCPGIDEKALRAAGLDTACGTEQKSLSYSSWPTEANCGCSARACGPGTSHNLTLASEDVAGASIRSSNRAISQPRENYNEIH
jgi:glutaredoxin 3